MKEQCPIKTPWNARFSPRFAFRNNSQSGFTLIELIVVIITIGVLISLATTRLFRMVEFSRGQEALNISGAIRKAMERCYVIEGSYTNCSMNDLHIEDPSSAAGSHFSYAISVVGSTEYKVVATRNTFSGGDNASTITVWQDATEVTRSGTGKFVGIK